MIVGFQNKLYVCVLKTRLLGYSCLRIVIFQEYRQEHRCSKGSSHTDNKELAGKLAKVRILHPL